MMVLNNKYIIACCIKINKGKKKYFSQAKLYD
jgi:hypothetical protein